jgi:hypothetical protein
MPPAISLIVILGVRLKQKESKKEKGKSKNFLILAAGSPSARPRL